MVSAPLYVFFGWLSDRLGRKFVMIGGMALALVLYFPASHWIAGAANPALVEAQAATPVIIETDLGTCSIQFDPLGTARFTSPCDIAKGALVTKGISFITRTSPDAATRVVLFHYSPVKDTVVGERPEIYPFLGSYLLARAVDEVGADLVVHGHAHGGSEQGVTPGGIRVRNVAQPLIKRAYRVFSLEPAPATARAAV